MSPLIHKLFTSRCPALIAGRRTGKTQAVQQFMEEHVNHNARVLRDIDHQLAGICLTNGINITEADTIGGKLSMIVDHFNTQCDTIAKLMGDVVDQRETIEEWEHIISKMNEQVDAVLRLLNQHPGQHASYLDLLDRITQRLTYLNSRCVHLEEDYVREKRDKEDLAKLIWQVRRVAVAGLEGVGEQADVLDSLPALVERLGTVAKERHHAANAGAHKRDEVNALLYEAEEELDRCVTANMEMRAALDSMTEELQNRGYTIKDLLADKAWFRRVQASALFASQFIKSHASLWEDAVLARLANDLESAATNRDIPE